VSGEAAGQTSKLCAQSRFRRCDQGNIESNHAPQAACRGAPHSG
jgi:hypothetical protein